MALRDKRILITGAARGLGHHIAALLASEGCSLTIVDREPTNVPNTKSVICDLSDSSERKRLIASLPKVEVLINCAGVGSHSTLAQMSVDEVERVMQVNALAPLALIAGLKPELVVNIGSVAGELHLPSIGLYAASKTAMHAFTRSIALEGVRTLLVILGPLRGTGFVKSIEHPRTGQPQWYRDLDLDAEDAAKAIVHAIKRGRRELVMPWWYRVVFVAGNVLKPFVRIFS